MVNGVDERDGARSDKRRGRILLNLPTELADRLRTLAKRERRPLTTQVEILLERALESELVA